MSDAQKAPFRIVMNRNTMSEEEEEQFLADLSAIAGVPIEEIEKPVFTDFFEPDDLVP